jgi:hypothetical protein
VGAVFYACTRLVVFVLYSFGSVYAVYTVLVACILYNVGGGYTSNVCVKISVTNFSGPNFLGPINLLQASGQGDEVDLFEYCNRDCAIAISIRTCIIFRGSTLDEIGRCSAFVNIINMITSQSLAPSSIQIF